MKKALLKIVSAVLCVCLFAGTFALPDATATQDYIGSDIPVVYLCGSGASLVVDNEDGSTTEIYPIKLADGQLEAIVKDNIDVFARAFFTQKWGEFCDVLYEIVTDLYKDIALDENGEAPNGARCYWSWDPNLGDRKNSHGKYDIQAYTFVYDWRMDPYKIADDLRRYIEDVRRSTGHDKVALLGRCLGASITSAYMDKYDAEYVSDYIVYCGAHCGAAMCSKIFCGEMFLEPEGIERFIYDKELFDDALINDLLQSFVTVLNDTYGLEIACWAVNNVYEDIYLDIVPRILVETFATFPGYWSMVTEEDYEKAKQVVFYGADKEKYKNFIHILDNYHYNVTNEMTEDYTRYQNMGIDIFNVTKYGFQNTPLGTEEVNAVRSDLTCHVVHASMGATATPINEVFTDKYIAAAEAKGTAKYISPDREIDASTAFDPDRTWFVKNLVHDHFPLSVDVLFSNMINEENFNVFSSERYPQYMVYSEETDNIHPLTAENMNTTDHWNTSFFEALLKLFKCLFELAFTQRAE